MADVSVKALKNGPYEVSGGAKLFDHQDNEYPEDQLDPLFLCRCVIRRANRSVTAVMPTWDLRPKKPQARQNRSIGSLTIKSL